MKLITKDVVSAFLFSSLLLANIAGTARRNITKPGQRIGQEVDLCFRFVLETFARVTREKLGLPSRAQSPGHKGRHPLRMNR